MADQAGTAPKYAVQLPSNFGNIDATVVRTGWAGTLWDLGGSKIGEVDQFQIRLNVSAIELRRLGTNQTQDVPDTWKGTVTCREIVVDDSRFLIPALSAYAEGNTGVGGAAVSAANFPGIPMVNLVGKLKPARASGQALEVRLFHCVPVREIPILDIRSGEMVVRNWEFTINGRIQIVRRFVTVGPARALDTSWASSVGR